MSATRTAAADPSRCSFEAADADAFCRLFMGAVAEDGHHRSYEGEDMVELWGLSGRLRDPRARLLTSSAYPQIFNPALAVARWLYMFSGSDRLADIVAYSPGAARFTDDGVTMPGGSHGARAFSPVAGVDQVERVVETLAELGETTNGVLALHHPTDLATPTNDYICVTSALLTIRGPQLHCMLQMRSNEVLRLLWYDLFEFTMLAEYVAARLGLELGSYVHSGFVFQITGGGDRGRAVEVAAEAATSPTMGAMPPMTRADRARVVDLERRLRESSRHAPDGAFADLLGGLGDSVEPYWADLLGAAALQARLVATEGGKRMRLLDALRGLLPGQVSGLCLSYSEQLLRRSSL